jgi:hypothetical protein
MRFHGTTPSFTRTLGSTPDRLGSPVRAVNVDCLPLSKAVYKREKRKDRKKKKVPKQGVTISRVGGSWGATTETCLEGGDVKRVQSAWQEWDSCSGAERTFRREPLPENDDVSGQS